MSTADKSDDDYDIELEEPVIDDDPAERPEEIARQSRMGVNPDRPMQQSTRQNSVSGGTEAPGSE
ncbi:hypothetical protein M2405_004280 [Rhodococcus erythropolis]|nr:hypothetical protein [Rhodococcus erythropolis]MCW2425494.1 hypothetical protein [Rhodococcus erythropolis]